MTLATERPLRPPEGAGKGRLGFGTRRVLRWDPYLEPDDSDMRFRLTYQGLLLAHRDDDGKRAGAQHKHAIRREFHKQLKSLWSVNPVLKLRTEAKVGYERETPEAIAENHKRDGFRFVPLVREDYGLVCSLDILMLRHGAQGGIINNSDVDNKLKTLFDALRLTTNKLELGGAVPEADEDPFYVLLLDDKLITHVTIETDALLQPVNGDVNDVRLVISVAVRPTNMSLVGSSEYL